MFKLPYIPTAEELIDNAFRIGSREAKKARSTRKNRNVRLKQSDFRRVEVASKFIESNLKSVVKNFPSFNSLSPFQQELLNIQVDRNRYKKSLGAVDWCLKKISALGRSEIASIRRNQSTGREFLGRTASLIKRIKKDLDFLVEVKNAMKNLPAVEDSPTLVVAGFPNVGKSTFVKNLTGSNIEVKPYPFTTKSIMVGRLTIRHIRYQIIDSPGLLERPMEERNKIELQAITALKHLADKILFLIDPTQEVEPQLKLLDEITKLFKVEVYAGINKTDVLETNVVIEDIEGMISGYRVFKLTANDTEDCMRVFKAVFALS
ncbi:MAG: GTP-binding protein [Candidatus Altiarchaeales archaeon]|nr:GTP-binding protein [Candidatus Altiarchaeales archaeon]